MIKETGPNTGSGSSGGCGTPTIPPNVCPSMSPYPFGMDQTSGYPPSSYGGVVNPNG